MEIIKENYLQLYEGSYVVDNVVKMSDISDAKLPVILSPDTCGGLINKKHDGLPLPE
jgi:hypothetical protein